MINNKQSKDLSIILSAPSGGGKSSIARKLIELDKNLLLSISATTRKPRISEKNNVHYFFKSRESFQQMIDTDKFFEFTEIYGNLYGTPKKYVENMLANGVGVLFDIDYQGADQVMKKMPDKTLSIFIKPPSIKILRQRLKNRDQDSREIINKRIMLAKEEMGNAKHFDYIVVNDNFNQTISKIQSIINQERFKNKKKQKKIYGSFFRSYN